MMNWDKILTDRTLRIVIIIKMIVAIVIILSLTDVLKFGDRPLLAEGEETAAKTEEPKTELAQNTAKPETGEKPDNKEKAADEAKAKKPEAKETPAQAKGEDKAEAAKAGEADKPKTEVKRRSFLDRLLNLPKLDTDNLKKDDIGHYLNLVEKKTAQVEARLEILKKKEQQLINLENSIDGKLKQLDEEQLYFAETIQKEKVIKDERLKQLIEFYKKMEPKKAAPIFEKLDKDLVIALFKAIPEKQITNFLAEMNPQRSIELTEYYGRIRSMREYDVLKELNQSLRSEFDNCKGMPLSEK